MDGVLRGTRAGWKGRQVLTLRGGRFPWPFVCAAVALGGLVWLFVAPQWRSRAVDRRGVAPSPQLVDVYMAQLCRPPTDAETLFWDTKPFTVPQLVAEIRATDESVRVRAIRRVHLDVLLRDPFHGDCEGLRRWVDRPLSPHEVARRLASLPEARRVSAVRQLLTEVERRDPAGWDNGSVRRWAESGMALSEIRERVGARRPLVGVHYFTWYERESVRWGNGGTSLVPDDTQKPELGWYDSSDVATIDRHIEQLEAAGFDFIILQMWVMKPHIWATTHRFFDRLKGRRLKAVVMLDGLYEGLPSEVAGWVRRARAEFGDSPNYFFLRGQPLVLLYSARLDFPVPGIQVRNVYWAARYAQGDNRFNADQLLYPHDWPFWSPAPQPVVNGVVPVLPGYTDAHLGRTESMEYSRNAGRMYHEQWQRALALRPEFIIVYSWNEHFERTAIEPTAAWGDQYVKWTACYVAHAHAGRQATC
jgi:hypothetical protein